MSEIVENRYHQDEDAEKPNPSGGTFKRLFLQPEKHNTYWEVDGLLKNLSNKKQYLKIIIIKIYTNDENNILLTEGFIGMNESLLTNQTAPFQVRAKLDRMNDFSAKYFDINDEVRIYVYPYFLTCN